jgi:hypothetical protein
MIWDLTIPDGQLIRVGRKYGIDAATDEEVLVEPFAVFYKIPVLAHAYKEAREYAERCFTFMYAGRFGPDVWTGAKNVLYFDDPLSCMLFFGNSQITVTELRSNFLRELCMMFLPLLSGIFRQRSSGICERYIEWVDPR